MFKRIAVIISVLFMTVGCVSIQVKPPKDPIKVDLTMRLDVYQHVEKDINAIEDMVSGPDKPVGKQSWLPSLVNEAYAEDGFGPDVEEAAAGRKARKAQVMSLLAKGAIGENSRGMLEPGLQGKSDPAAAEVIKAENKDRAIIYRAIARKNGTSYEEVAEMYSKRLQNDAPSGAPIETPSGWQTK